MASQANDTEVMADSSLKPLMDNLIKAQNDIKSLNPPEKLKQLKLLRGLVKDCKEKLGEQMSSQQLTCVKYGTYAVHNRVTKVKLPWDQVVEPALAAFDALKKPYVALDVATFIAAWRDDPDHCVSRNSLSLRQAKAGKAAGAPGGKRRKAQKAENQEETQEEKDEEVEPAQKREKKDNGLFFV